MTLFPSLSHSSYFQFTTAGGSTNNFSSEPIFTQVSNLILHVNNYLHTIMTSPAFRVAVKRKQSYRNDTRIRFFFALILKIFRRNNSFQIELEFWEEIGKDYQNKAQTKGTKPTKLAFSALQPGKGQLLRFCFFFVMLFLHSLLLSKRKLQKIY